MRSCTSATNLFGSVITIVHDRRLLPASLSFQFDHTLANVIGGLSHAARSRWQPCAGPQYRLARSPSEDAR
jgi:hypothetical protein